MAARKVIGAGKAKRTPATTPVTLVGEDYTLYAPKAMRWLTMARMQQAGMLAQPAEVGSELVQYWKAIFGPEQYALIDGRASDPFDPLDLEDLIELVEYSLDHFKPTMRKKLEAMGVDPDNLQDLDEEQDKPAARAPRPRRASTASRR